MRKTFIEYEQELKRQCFFIQIILIVTSPCFLSKYSKPGQNLAGTYPKQKGSTLLKA